MDTVLRYTRDVLRVVDPEFKTGEIFIEPLNEITRKQFYLSDENRCMGDTFVDANEGTVYVWQGDQWAILRADDRRVRFWRA